MSHFATNMIDIFRILIIVSVIGLLVAFFEADNLSFIALPEFFNIIDEHVRAAGKFSLSRAGLWILVVYVPCVLYSNMMALLFWEPPVEPRKMRSTLSTITGKDVSLIYVDQPEPNVLIIYSTPYFIVDEKFCREHEAQIESGCGIDITDFWIHKSGQIKMKFIPAKTRHRRTANIWRVGANGSLVQDAQSHGFGYAIHDGRTMKVGFADTMTNAKIRIAERRRQCPGSNDWKFFVCRSRREETAIRDLLTKSGAALADPSEAGREVFDYTVPAAQKWFDKLEEVFEG